MTKKAAFFLVLVVFMLLATVQGATADLDTNLLAYYTMNASGDPVADDYTSLLNLSYYGTPVYTIPAKNSGGYNQTKTDQLAMNGPTFGTSLNGTTSVCLSAWIRFPATIGSGAYQWLFDIRATNDTNKYSLAVATDVSTPANNLNFVTNDGSFYDSAPFAPKKESLNHYVFCHLGGTRWVAWENATVLLNATHAAANPPGTFALEMMDNANGGTGIPNSVLWDEVAVWNRQLNQEDVDALYNSGAGCFLDCLTGAPPGTPSEPSWVAPTPNDGATNNTQEVLNASCDAGLNYYVYFDGVNPPVTAVVSNATTGNYTTVATPGTYYYSAACYNVTSGLYSTNTNPRSWTYDIQAPAILLNANNEFNDDNYSLFSPYDDIVNISVNFTDDRDLYAYNVSILSVDNGSFMFTEQAANLSGTASSYFKSLNVSTWDSGWFIVNLTVSDSHTANKIPVYEVTKKKSSITFKPGNDNNIKIETQDASNINALKLLDRYSFTMSFDDGLTKNRVFDVKTDKCPLEYRSESGYKAHFVSACGVDGNWIDFEGVTGSATVTRIDDYHYRVMIEDVPSVVTFNSIGGLNIYNRVLSFYRGTYVIDADRATAGNLFEISINLTTDDILSLNTSFSWNGTAKAVTNENGTGWAYYLASFTNETVGDYWYIWSVTATMDDGNSSTINVNNTLEVEDWYLDDCSGASVVTINWTQYDEDTPGNTLAGTAQLLMVYWLDNTSVNKTLNVSYANNTYFQVCLSPSNLTFHGDIYLQNTVADAFTHRFYVQNGSFNATMTRYSIYNFLNQTVKSDMKITTRLNDDYSYYENVLVYLQRLYVGEGVWRTVQMDRSGDYGLVFFNIKEENTDYRLIYYDQYNNVLYTTTSMKFVCSATICDLTQLLNSYEATSTSSEVTATLSFNNATNVITVAWTGPPTETHTVTFSASRESITGPYTVCSSTQVGASGSFVCNATNESGELFVTAKVDGETFAVSEWVDISAESLNDQMSQAERSLWSFGFAATITMIGLFSPVGVIIALVMALVSLFFMGILSVMSVSLIILASVVGIAISLKVRT